jgi:hypothetical protein
MSFSTKDFKQGIPVPIELATCPICLKPLIARLPESADKVQNMTDLYEAIEVTCSHDTTHRPLSKSQPISDWPLHDRWSYIKLTISKQWKP